MNSKESREGVFQVLPSSDLIANRRSRETHLNLTHARFDRRVNQTCADHRSNQVIGDLSIAVATDAHRAPLQSADLIFADGPKNGVFEDT